MTRAVPDLLSCCRADCLPAAHTPMALLQGGAGGAGLCSMRGKAVKLPKGPRQQETLQQGHPSAACGEVGASRSAGAAGMAGMPLRSLVQSLQACLAAQQTLLPAPVAVAPCFGVGD